MARGRGRGARPPPRPAAAFVFSHRSRKCGGLNHHCSSQDNIGITFPEGDCYGSSRPASSTVTTVSVRRRVYPQAYLEISDVLKTLAEIDNGLLASLPRTRMHRATRVCFDSDLHT